MCSDPVVERPTYLHFLDRELAVAAGASPTPAQVEGLLRTLLVGTASGLCVQCLCALGKRCARKPVTGSAHDDLGRVATV